MDWTGAMDSSDFYPGSPEDLLKSRYIGKDLRDIDVYGPQAVLDLAVVKKNCELMLNTTKELGLSFRAHVKTHKTRQVTRLQVGEAPNAVQLIASTAAEAENLLPYLRECTEQKRRVNLLYGIPPSRSSIPRMLRIRRELGSESVIFMIDNITQLDLLERDLEHETEPVLVFVKIDGGYSRAGLQPEGEALSELLRMILQKSKIKLYGFYCHHGSSYGVSGPQEALSDLKHEIDTLRAAASKWSTLELGGRRIVLSAGATPTATSAQNLLAASSHPTLKSLLTQVKEDHELEIHAGVYPFLDLQQLATHARPSNSLDSPTMDMSDLGFRVLADVLSVYTERENPEMLIGAGSLALGREPCKSYSGWGVVAPCPWKQGGEQIIYSEERQTGWIVGRISQEHGILTWQGSRDKMQLFEVGEKLLVWPNHACIAGAGFGWYLIVDSGNDNTGTSKIIDVWTRWRGW